LSEKCSPELRRDNLSEETAPDRCDEAGRHMIEDDDSNEHVCRRLALLEEKWKEGDGEPAGRIDRDPDEGRSFPARALLHDPDSRGLGKSAEERGEGGEDAQLEKRGVKEDGQGADVCFAGA